jgi:hypothetical protein
MRVQKPLSLPNRLELPHPSLPYPSRLLRLLCPIILILLGTTNSQTPYRDGTTQVAFEPVDFIARLAALVPKPRVNLTRYHGILAPNHRWRGEVTPARRGKALKTGANAEVRTPAECHAAMTWAQRLKRMFNIDIEVCSRCGGSVKVIACIEEQDAIDRILAHLESKEHNTPALPHLAPPTRASPETLPLFAGTEFHQQGRH